MNKSPLRRFVVTTLVVLDAGKRLLRTPHARLGSVIAATLASCILLIAGFDAWGLTWQTVSGQTVPRTPPPTFTPTRTATPRVTPTHTPLPTATATLQPGAPTPVPKADLFITLEVRPRIVGPGQLVTFACQVVNRGNAPGTEVEISLSIAWPLAVEDASSSKGTVRQDGQESIVSLDDLPPGEDVAITLRTRVQQNASPGRILRYRAQLRFKEGSGESNQAELELPAAVLPATGE